jgi:hypothetical protein
MLGPNRCHPNRAPWTCPKGREVVGCAKEKHRRSWDMIGYDWILLDLIRNYWILAWLVGSDHLSNRFRENDFWCGLYAPIFGAALIAASALQWYQSHGAAAPGPQIQPGIRTSLPSGYVKIAIENGHRNSGFSHEKWWFSIVMSQFTRGYIMIWYDLMLGGMPFGG